MIDAQAKLITRLNREIADLQKHISVLNPKAEAGEFYLKLQKAVIANPSLQILWDEMLITLKMIDQERVGH